MPDFKPDNLLQDKIQFERDFMVGELERSLQEERNNLDDRNTFVSFLFTALTILIGLSSLVFERLITSPPTINEDFALFIFLMASWGGLSILVLTFLRGVTNISKVGFSLVRIWVARDYLKKYLDNPSHLINDQRVLGKSDTLYFQANSFTTPITIMMTFYTLFMSMVATLTAWLTWRTIIRILNHPNASFNIDIEIILSFIFILLIWFLSMMFFLKRKHKMKEHIEQTLKRLESDQLRFDTENKATINILLQNFFENAEVIIQQLGKEFTARDFIKEAMRQNQEAYNNLRTAIEENSSLKRQISLYLNQIAESLGYSAVEPTQSENTRKSMKYRKSK